MVYKRTGVTLMDQLNNVNMSRSIASFAIVVLFQAAFAIDVFKPENLPPNLQLNYINRDAVPITAFETFISQISTHPNGFIGDLEIGKRTENDKLASVITYRGDNNDKNIWYIPDLGGVTLSNGTINYVSVFNAENSYAVICGNSSGLGSNKSPKFWARVPPKTKVDFTMLIYYINAH